MRNKSLIPSSQNSHRVSLRSSLARPERPVTLQPAREKITRVFRYLEALNQHRNPVQRQIGSQPWSLWLHELPSHSSVQRGVTSPGSVTPSRLDTKIQNIDKPNIEDFVFKVQRPRLSQAPEPPKELALWLKEGWDDPAKEVTLQETRNERD